MQVTLPGNGVDGSHRRAKLQWYPLHMLPFRSLDPAHSGMWAGQGGFDVIIKDSYIFFHSRSSFA